jgi:hypothetical protein
MNASQKRYLEKRMEKEAQEDVFKNWLKTQPRSIQLKWICGWSPNKLVIFNSFSMSNVGV